MDFFTKLLAPETADNIALKSAELSFREWMPWPLAVCLFLALVAGVIFFYLTEKGTLGPIRRVLAIGLRIGLFALLFLLLFRPSVLMQFEGKRQRGVAVLLDNSQSMKQQDRRLTEADKWRVALAKGLTPIGGGLRESTH